MSPILSAIYTSGLIKWVEEKVSGIEGISFVDNVEWMATRSDVIEVVRTLESGTRESLNWAERRELEFHSAKTEAAHFTRRRGHKKHLHPKLTAQIRVGNGFLRFIKKATQGLGV